MTFMKKNGAIFDPRATMIDCRLCCDGTWDYLQSRVGRKRIRMILAPFFLVASIILLVIGATWAKVLAPECGQDLPSARFSISNGVAKRILSGNSCPGYDWNSQKRPIDRETAGEYRFSYSLPLAPVISMMPFYVGMTNSVSGPIGVALNGIPIYGPSAKNGENTVESNVQTFDQCGGYSSPPYRGPFSAPITGYYHYTAMPGVRHPQNTGERNNNDDNRYYCPEINNWYNESSSEHSPIVGFMADGIPIYGPYTNNGESPTDLDECGGHSSDLPPVPGMPNNNNNNDKNPSFYHYHFQSIYPYSVNCLKGCVDGTINNEINNICNINPNIKYNYTSLESMKIDYGGYGINHTSWTGPACLLVFGFLLFLPSALFSMCICCSSNKENNEFKGSLADMEEYDEHTGDNVL